ncbi:lysophospholipid acyltransferase family protein [Nannocystis sp.]|uniref:lysophospholipid acyltransferase family protein n=1 Tax=Nannocystis sp. TaxID=1962667 RepID=UPI0025F8263C|nr:lysophospholipid acyltransferase family protein [Nannocystis sp.]MBK7826759.1 1-acyl-sn-glycerol-3-phosphate acyltransferase [Nannocystis sp.]
MPKFLRILLSASAFAAFFFTASVLGRLLLPIVVHWPGSPERRQARRQRLLLLSYRSFIGYMRALRLMGYIPGADDRALPEASDGESGEDRSPVLLRMVEHLRSGHPLLVFPEASRSHERSLRRFRRGAIEAAIRAGVPIVPAFISVVPPMLMKHQAWYDVPARGGRYTVEFFPVITTAGQSLDSRVLARELRARYEQRHAQMLAERDALAAASSRKALA